MKQVDVSIIFVYYNTPVEILNAVNSIKKAVGGFSFQIIIVNNDSPIEPPKKIFLKNKIKYIKNKNVGYGEGLNKGAKIASGKYLLFNNSDIIFEKNSISNMLKKMINDSSIGIIGPAFLDEKGKIRKVGNSKPILPDVIFALSSLNNIFPNNYFSKKYFIKDFDRKTERFIPVLCGACMMMSMKSFKKINGFDKRFFMYFEEADICNRINKIGLRVCYYPKSRVIHYVGKSLNDLKWIEKTFEESRFKFLKKYHGSIVGTIGESIIRLINFPSKFI